MCVIYRQYTKDIFGLIKLVRVLMILRNAIVDSKINHQVRYIAAAKQSIILGHLKKYFNNKNVVIAMIKLIYFIIRVFIMFGKINRTFG